MFHHDLWHRHRPFNDHQYHDTTPAESYALMTPRMLLTLGLWRVSRDYCLLDQNHPTTSRLRSVLFRGANILISVLLILLVAALFYKDYASLFR
ncbi:MAG: phosphoethanolamine transferase domain-containing protein [Escherichia sp.]